MPTFDHGYALLVGVGADLPATVKDALRVGGLLGDPLRGGYRSENVKVLVGKEATRQNVLQALDWLVQCHWNDPLATVIFYYSGHGFAEPASLVLNGCFDGERFQAEKLDQEGLPGELLCEKLGDINSQKLLVLLDCCYAQAHTFTFKSPEQEPGFLSRLTAGAGRVVLSSCTAEEKSRIEGLESLFTAVLLEGLAGYGTLDCDGYAKIFEITDYVLKEVVYRSGGKQHPVFKGDVMSQNFAVAFYAGGQFWQRPLDVESPLPPRMPTQLESESERQLFENLKTLRKKVRLLQDRLADPGAAAQESADQQELEACQRKVFTLEASLGLLYQQTPFHLHLSQWWSRFGLANFVLGFFGWWSLQSGWRTDLYGETNRGSVSVILLMLSAVCFAGLYFTGAFFQSHGTRGPWYYRLPIPFGFRHMFFEPKFAKIAQALALLLFLLVPLWFQVYFFQRIAKESLWEFRPTENSDGAWFDTGIQGGEHWTRYFSLRQSLMGDKYALGRRETESQAKSTDTRREGITYFPFWGTWALTAAYASWIALFFRLLRRIGLIPDSRSRLIPELSSARTGG